MTRDLDRRSSLPSSPASRPRASGAVLAALLLAATACGGDDDDAPPPCQSDAECRMGERCVPGGECRLGVECVAEDECSTEDPRTTCNLETFACDFRPGFGDECGPGRPCPFGQFCSELLGLCRESASARDCTRRSQCPANQICDRSANKCIPDPGCYGDAFCEPGEVCDLVNRTCRSASEQCTSCLLGPCSGGLLCLNDTKECLTLEAEPICRTGEVCDPLGRCAQCLSDDDCGPGTFCNGSVGQCESNVQCADDPSECPDVVQVQCIVCTKPQVCDRRTRRCAAPPEPCESDVDCPNDQLCDQALEPPVCVPRLPDCINDLYDSPRNDGPGASRTLLAEDGPIYDELALCPGDQDWFRLEVPGGTVLTVDARFRHAEGDLELQLYLPDGVTLLDQSRSTTDNERVELEAGTDLTVLVRTFLGTQTVRPLDYQLVVTRDPGTVCPDDAAEPNDGPAQANQLTVGLPFEGRVCSADPDWFALRSVPAGSRVVVDLDFTDNLGDLDLEIYRAGSPRPLRTSQGTTDGERIELDAPYGGDFFVRVVGRGADANVYTIRATLLEGMGGACVDDALEPNDAPQIFTSAGPLLGTPQLLSLCGGDEDWFEVELAPREIVQAEIEFDPSQDLDLSLLAPGTRDPNESPLTDSVSVFPREFLAYRSLLGGRYLLRVYGSRPFDASDYTLNLTKVREAACVPDANDLAGIGGDTTSAIDLGFPPNREGDQTICTGDVDVYRFFVLGGFNNVISLQYASDLATLDFAVLNFDGSQLFSSVGQDLRNRREVTLTVPGNGIGIGFLRISSTDSRTAPYSVAVDLVPSFACNPDVAEPNETAAQASTRTATTTSPIQLPNLTLCPSTRRTVGNQLVGDEDWFVLTPPAVGARIDASVTSQQGDLLLELRSPGGAVRACPNRGADRCYSDGNGLTERVTFTATTTAPYLLRVGSVYSASTVPVRPATADTPYQLDVRYAAP